jgi:hypothetical protein
LGHLAIVTLHELRHRVEHNHLQAEALERDED